METYEEIVELYTATHPNVATSKMFGWDCLTVNGNVFLAGAPEGMNFKLSQGKIIEAKMMTGVDNFNPMGRPMKEWVQAPYENVPQLKTLAEWALEYVSTLPPKVKKKK